MTHAPGDGLIDGDAGANVGGTFPEADAGQEGSVSAGMVAGAKAKKYADAADPYTDTAYTTDPGYNFSITCHGYDKWGLETFRRGPISCEIGEFLRAEWDRKVKGKKVKARVLEG